MSSNLLTAEQVADRLGVKLETVYAYVSRGTLRRTLAADGRTSRFDATEVELLARRGRPRQPSGRAAMGVADVVLATSITSLRDDRLVYRGYDATELATGSTFEAVAELLWSGALPASASFAARPDARRVAEAATKGLPDRSPVSERLAVVA